MIPEYVFFTKGVGVHKDKLQSFELALRDAGIQQLNLVSVSSIFPPKAKRIPRERGVEMLKPGQITFVVLARNETNEPNRLMAASIGLARPADKKTYGYLSENHSFGETAQTSGNYAEDLAASMLASTLGIKFDPDTAYNKRKDIYKMSGKIVNTRSITQSARGNKDGKWTSVVSAAVFVPPKLQQD